MSCRPWLAALLCFCCAPVFAQNWGEQYPLSGALLPESDSTQQALAEARRSIAAADWDSAARQLQQLLETYPNKVLPVSRQTYSGVADRCRALLRSLPPEGRQAYCKRFDPPLRVRFELARMRRDARALWALARRYPIATYAASALRAASELHLERAEFAAALRALQQLRQDFPDAFGLPSVVRLALCHARLGQAQALRQLRAELNDSPLLELPLAAFGASLEKFLEHCLELARSAEQASALPEREPLAGWPTLGGDHGRNRLARLPSNFPIRVWDAYIDPPAQRRLDELRYRLPYGGFLAFPHFPSLANGMAYLGNGLSVAAYSLCPPSGAAHRVWSLGPALPSESVLYAERALGTVSFHEGLCLATVVGNMHAQESKLRTILVKAPFPCRRLVALDALTGRLRWEFGGDPGATQFEKRVSVAQPPAARGGRLWVGVIDQTTATDPFTHYLCCLEASSGRILWKTFVASGFLEINLFNNPVRECLGSHVCLDGDLALYCTNLGAVAAVDAATGELRWITRYSQVPMLPPPGIYPELLPSGWMNMPPVVVETTVLATPTDSPYLLALDRESGRLRWRAERRSEEGDEMRYLLGATRDRVVVQGDRRVHAFDPSRNGLRAWVAEPAGMPRGRGVLTESGAWIPHAGGVDVFELQTGKLERQVGWPTGGVSGGNLVAADGAVAVCAPDRLLVFYDPQEMNRRLQEALRSAPSDPVVHYRIGSLFAQQGRFDEALEHFDRALEMTQARGAESEAFLKLVKRSVFDMTFENGLELWAQGRRSEALQRLREARRLSPDPAHTVKVCTTQARFFEQQGSLREAVELLQWLLETHPEQSVGDVSAWEQSRSEIRRLLEAHGKQLYEGVEERAARALAAASASGSRVALDAVVKRFPNSEAACRTLVIAGRRAYAQGELDAASLHLQRYLQNHPEGEELPEVLCLLALTCERRAMYGRARDLLRELKRRFPGAEVHPVDSASPLRAGRFVEERLAKEEYQHIAEWGKPVLRLPLGEPWSYRIPGVKVVRPLQPQGCLGETARKQLWVEGVGEIHALDRDRGVLLWRARTGATIRDAAVHEERLVLGQATRLRCLSLGDGSELWEKPLEEYSLDRLYYSRGLLFVLSYPLKQEPEVRVECREALDGTLLWSRSLRGFLSPSDVLLTDDHVVIASRGEAYIISRLSGEVCKLRLRRLAARRLLYSSPGILCTLSESSGINGYDIETGTELWQAQPSGPLLVEQAAAFGSRLVLVAFGRKQPGGGWPVNLVRVDTADGTLTCFEELGSVPSPPTLFDGERAYLISRKRDDQNQLVLRGVPVPADSEEASEAEGWEYLPLVGAQRTLFELIEAREHLVLSLPELDAQRGAFVPQFVVLRKDTGKLERQWRSEHRGRLPLLALSNGCLIVALDDTVYVHPGREE